jgi:hypothetical protein
MSASPFLRNNQAQNKPDADGNKQANGNPRTGLVGQGGGLPFSMFNNHVLVQIGDVLYDPSYGVFYDQATQQERLNALETNAIAGYAISYKPKNVANAVAVLKIRPSTGAGGLKLIWYAKVH